MGAMLNEQSADGDQRYAGLRTHRRSPVSIRAILYHRDTFQTTMISDFSQGGLGLNGAFGVFLHDEVEIRLTTGEAAFGKVCWWIAGRCGVQFRAPLAEDDPFYRRLVYKLERQAFASSSGR